MKQLPCPFCKAHHSADDARIWPFCSERCKQADLGKWATGAYVVPGGTIRNEDFTELLPDEGLSDASGDESES